MEGLRLFNSSLGKELSFTSLVHERGYNSIASQTMFTIDKEPNKPSDIRERDVLFLTYKNTTLWVGFAQTLEVALGEDGNDPIINVIGRERSGDLIQTFCPDLLFSELTSFIGIVESVVRATGINIPVTETRATKGLGSIKNLQTNRSMTAFEWLNNLGKRVGFLIRGTEDGGIQISREPEDSELFRMDYKVYNFHYFSNYDKMYNKYIVYGQSSLYDAKLNDVFATYLIPSVIAPLTYTEFIMPLNVNEADIRSRWSANLHNAQGRYIYFDTGDFENSKGNPYKVGQIFEYDNPSMGVGGVFRISRLEYLYSTEKQTVRIHAVSVSAFSLRDDSLFRRNEYVPT